MSKRTLPILVLILVMACTMCTSLMVVSAEGEATTPQSEVKILHVTDTHYIPSYYCYQGDLKENDFATKIKGDPKLMLESYAVLVETIDMIKTSHPDYVFLTGDITSNGEMQALIDIANALRQVQNEVRATTNPNMQILVCPGNHDVFNNRHASNYNYKDGKKKEARSASRWEFVRIFAGLGYPDMPDEATAKAFYDGDGRDAWFVNGKHLPYTPNGDVTYIDSKNRADLRFEYFDSDLDGEDLDELGGLTYVAYDDTKKLAIASFDTTLSVRGDQRTEGEFTKANIDWYTAKDLTGYTQMSLAHHNIINHHPKQEEYTQAFVTYGWEETAEALASNGLRYSFTGHFHANDVASYVSFNNNVMYDIETGATISQGAAVREVTVQDFGEGKQNLVSKLLPVAKMDVSYLISKGIMPEGYDDCFIDKSKGIIDVQKYIDAKLFKPYLENMIDSFISTTKIYAKLDTLGKKEFELLGNKYTIDLKEIVYALLNEVNTKTLKDYTYGGDMDSLKKTENKVIGYLHELLSDAIKMEVAKGHSFEELVIFSYGAHLMGAEARTVEDLPKWVQEAFDGFRYGDMMDKVLDKLLFADDGIYNLVDKLAKTPLDLTKCSNSIKTIKQLVSALKLDVELDKVVLNDLVPKLLSMNTVQMLLSKAGIKLNLEGDTLMAMVDGVLDNYLNDSMKQGIGSILVDIAASFATDESPDGAFNETVTYKVNEGDAYSILGDHKGTIAPTYANGRMPQHLTMTFGKDPSSTMNFVWFTSIFSPDNVLKYREVGATDWIEVKAERKLLPFSYPIFDFGLFTSRTDKNISRHNVRLSDLKAGATYEYTVGATYEYVQYNDSKEVWTEVGTFTLAPSDNGAFEVSIISDMQGMDKTNYIEAFDKLSKSNKLFGNGKPNFVINLGDLVRDGNNYNQWGYALDIGADYWRNTPEVFVAGGHENKNYISGKTNPRKQAHNIDIASTEYSPVQFHYDLGGSGLRNTKEYYSFDYSGVHFVVLDTNDVDKNSGTLSSSQVAWLEDDLKSTDKIKVVLMHKGIYSPGMHSKYSDIVAMRSQLSPIFYDNKVAIVFQGYDQVYAETPLLDGKGNEAEDGVLYVTMGTMSDNLYKYVDNDDVKVAFGKELHNPALKSQTMGKLAYDGTTLTYQGYMFRNNKFVEVEKYNSGMIWLYVILGVIVTAAIVFGIVMAVKKKNANKAMTTLEDAEENDN